MTADTDTDTDTDRDADVLVVGAGLAGLNAARHLSAAGRRVVVLEATDGPGGRVRTDVVDGYRLDRGFQVLLTAYPEAAEALDLGALDLARFDPGALIRIGDAWYEVADPTRRPRAAVSTLRTPIGGLRAKTRVASLGIAARWWPADGPVAGTDESTATWLAEAGLGGPMTDRFLRPLLAGILLDPDLGTSSRQARFVWRSLATGDVAVPALGMGELSVQLAARLPAGTLRLATPVVDVVPGAVTDATGRRWSAPEVVVATDGPSAARLVAGAGVNPPLEDPGSRAVGCAWYGAAAAPTASRAILLNGEVGGAVNEMAVMSNVSASYAPPGRALMAVTFFDLSGTDADVDGRLRPELAGWFPAADVGSWRLLRVDRILHAQPAQPPGSLFPPQRPVRLAPGLLVCGDHRDNASIQGALVSGRRAAAVLTA